MVKIARKDSRGCKHSSGSYKRKSGPKGARKGKQMQAKQSHLVKAREKASWNRKIPQLIASLALARGESMDAALSGWHCIPPLRLLRRLRTFSLT